MNVVTEQDAVNALHSLDHGCEGVIKPVNIGADRAGCSSVPLLYGLLVLKVMVTYPDSHMLLGVVVNSWVMSTALGQRETQSAGRSNNGLEMFQLGGETKTNWKTELALLAYFC